MIHHFYHIYADGKWQEPVSEHVRALKMGLYDNLNTFAIGIVGSAENRHAVIDYLNTEGLAYEVYAEALQGWEQETQIPMWLFSQDNAGAMLYAHSKGSSDPSDVNVRWRRSMDYWCTVRWQDAIEKLKDHDAYGSHWIQPLVSMPEHKKGNWMFAGTFFWLRCEVLARFPKPALTHRWEAEGFCGYGYAEKPYRVYDCAPYFPNTAPFADGWVNDESFKPENLGKTIEPVQTVNV